MPKEKTLFFIGIWIILLSNFIGLPTEIKNYLFIATALLVIAISYASNFPKINSEDNFFHKKTAEKKIEVPEVREKTFFKPKPFTSLKKEEKKIEPEINNTIPDLQNPFADIPRTSYEPVIKVRRARIKPKPKPVREEALPAVESNFNLNSEEDDVIVISSDGNVSRE